MDDALIEMALQNSFKNFHAEGMDYICMKRSPTHTIKYYFFDGDMSQISDVVNPHDHRYDFNTTVISGSMVDFRYRPCRPGDGQAMTAFEWRTPLNGGGGFSDPYEAYLRKTTSKPIKKGAQYFSPSEVIHTIRPTNDRTLIRLDQFEDKLDLEDYTTTFCLGHEAPSLTGLYERFTEAELVSRIDAIMALENIKPK